MLLTFETIMFPSKLENIFFIFEIFSFLTIAAIAGPFPETDAPSAPLSTKSTIILGSEFRIEDVKLIRLLSLLPSIFFHLLIPMHC